MRRRMYLQWQNPNSPSAIHPNNDHTTHPWWRSTNANLKQQSKLRLFSMRKQRFCKIVAFVPTSRPCLSWDQLSTCIVSVLAFQKLSTLRDLLLRLLQRSLRESVLWKIPFAEVDCWIQWCSEFLDGKSHATRDTQTRFLRLRFGWFCRDFFDRNGQHSFTCLSRWTFHFVSLFWSTWQK